MYIYIYTMCIHIWIRLICVYMYKCIYIYIYTCVYWHCIRYIRCLLATHWLGCISKCIEVLGTRAFSGCPLDQKGSSQLLLFVISLSVRFLKWTCPFEPSVSPMNTTMFRIFLDDLDDFVIPHVPPKKKKNLDTSPRPSSIPVAGFARSSSDINPKRIPTPGRNKIET